jgi:truncated hemoglobin YjbI
MLMHQQIPEMTYPMFVRWMELWEQTVRETLGSRPETDAIVEMATKMKRTMSRAMGLVPFRARTNELLP